MFESSNEANSALVVVSRTAEEQNILVSEKYETAKLVNNLNNSKVRTLTPYGALTFKK